MNDAPTCPECGGRDDWHKAGCSYTGATPPPAQSSGAEPAATETEPLGAQTSGPTTPPAKKRSSVASGFGGCFGVGLAFLAVGVAIFVILMLVAVGSTQ